MPIEIISEIVQKNNQPFALMDDSKIRGSYHVVEFLTDRDSINSDLRKFGMAVFVQENGLEYELQSDLITWSPKVSNGIEINFSWGDVSPELIYTIPIASTLLSVILSIDIPFNGFGCYIKIGDNIIDNSLMDSSENDPATIAIYSTTPSKKYNGGEQILLTFTPGSGGSQGAGRVKIIF